MPPELDEICARAMAWNRDERYARAGAMQQDLELLLQVFVVALRVLELLGPAPSFPLAFAALLHDVGKPRTVGRTPERYTFYYHEHVGARLADEIGERLRLSNVERERVTWLVEKHQFLCDARHMRTSKLKTMLVHPGIGELLALHRADAVASGKSADHVDYCEYLLREWTVDDLNKFLTAPRTYAPGTKMSFAGLARENQRADVIAYLNSLSDSQKPLPTAAPSGGDKAQPGGEKAQPKAGGESAPQGQSKPNPPPGQAQTEAPAKPGGSPQPAPGHKSE